MLYMHSCLPYFIGNRHRNLYQLIDTAPVFLAPLESDHLMCNRHHKMNERLAFFFWSWIYDFYFYGIRVLKYTLPVVCTFLIAWSIARCYDGAVMYYPVDTTTVHLLVWQCVGLMTLWQLHELPWLSLPFHQGSTCVLLALYAFYVYELCMRYVSVRYRLCFAWFVSIYDM
jgi:hypothetical protein